MRNELSTKLRTVVSWSDYKIDPRYFVLLFLSSFAVAGQVYLGFFQKWDAVIVSVIASAGTELVLYRLKRGTWQFPLSAVITGIGVSLLLSSHVVWAYALTSFLAIVIKYAIRFKGGHIFNPNNVAMVIMLFMLPEFAVSTPKQWTNGLPVMAAILALGIVVCYIANRLDSVLTFLGSFTLFALIRHFYFGAPLYAALGPLLGASLQLFSFFMITDPKSSPTTCKGRMLFAFSVAALDAVFRINRIPNPQFYALFVVCLLMLIPYRLWAERKVKAEAAIQS
ncbi:RnfABCDGE type electron transport complex subunit D [Paenibacillus oleatilyticus]|uniref:RnfABCDGE type electron transport complex subunit D n=1 Tax=Paenibacillus oleatilyticus TaxID=2594886 RepID=UPI001C1FF00F|nr:RnfABCDGE type electron transport complex subunit D [Paenibacillus oleatilyticus]MBU7316733.1 RnfABCDGE type electron transport complex subunit D [Paenibacillus oleatilyticus]